MAISPRQGKSLGRKPHLEGGGLKKGHVMMVANSGVNGSRIFQTAWLRDFRLGQSAFSALNGLETYNKTRWFYYVVHFLSVFGRGRPEGGLKFYIQFLGVSKHFMGKKSKKIESFFVDRHFFIK